MRSAVLAATMFAMMSSAMPVSAQLFIDRSPVEDTPATGSEAGLMQALPGATPDELRAGMVWTLRSGLNFAALQCQFSPALQTVDNYNDFLRQHKKELTAAYAKLGGYFKRTNKGPAGAVQFDQYTTRSVASFSTVYGQLGFCDTSSALGRESLSVPKGQLTDYAVKRILMLRRSLQPTYDRLWTPRLVGLQVDPIVDPCLDKRGRPKKKC